MIAKNGHDAQLDFNSARSRISHGSDSLKDIPGPNNRTSGFFSIQLSVPMSVNQEDGLIVSSPP